MSLLEKVDQVAINKLCPYAQALLKELEPIVKKIDPAQKLPIPTNVLVRLNDVSSDDIVAEKNHPFPRC